MNYIFAFERAACIRPACLSYIERSIILNISNRFFLDNSSSGLSNCQRHSSAVVELAISRVDYKSKIKITNGLGRGVRKIAMDDEEIEGGGACSGERGLA